MPRASEAPAVQLNLNVRGLRQSATLAINDRSAALRQQGREVFRLGFGQSPFPVPEEIVDALRANAGAKDYLPVAGLPALRDAVAAYYGRRHGLTRSGADVLVGPGSKELIFLLQLVYSGDLLIPSPSWVSYASQAQIVGRQIHWIPLEGDWPLTPGALDAACRTDPERPRLVVLNYPSNPTGQTYDAAQLEELATVARRYRLVVLSDEIYGELDHRGRHRSIAEFYPEGTIVSSGLSKWAGAGGWRLGTFLFPSTLRWLQDAMAVAASETFTSTSAPIQYAAVPAYRGSPAIEDYLVQSRRILASLGAASCGELREAGLVVDEPAGGFYLFPRFPMLPDAAPDLATSADLATRLLEETGIASLPGSDFGCRSELLALRFAYVDFDGGRALNAARAIPSDTPLDREFLLEYCAPVMQAIQRLVEWVRAL